MHDFQRATEAALERSDAGFDFDNRMSYGDEAEAAVGLGEDLAFDDASVVAEGDEFHLVACDLMVGTVGDDEAADSDALASVPSEVADWAIGIPGHFWELLERVAGDGEA